VTPAGARAPCGSLPLALTSKGGLPYKPRDFEPAGALIISIFGRLKAEALRVDRAARRRHQRRTPREADLSTEQARSQAPPRLPRAHGNYRRPQGALRAPQDRPQAAQRLICTATNPHSLAVERLRQRSDFLAAARAAKVTTAAFVLQARERVDGGPVRVGFTVSKKVGNAVERNRVRRRLREVVRLSAADNLRHGHDYVLIGRRPALSLPFEQLSEALERALRRLRAPR
jgi:ribonuclease P protein component